MILLRSKQRPQTKQLSKCIIILFFILRSRIKMPSNTQNLSFSLFVILYDGKRSWLLWLKWNQQRRGLAFLTGWTRNLHHNISQPVAKLVSNDPARGRPWCTLASEFAAFVSCARTHTKYPGGGRQVGPTDRGALLLLVYGRWAFDTRATPRRVAPRYWWSDEWRDKCNDQGWCQWYRGSLYPWQPDEKFRTRGALGEDLCLSWWRWWELHRYAQVWLVPTPARGRRHHHRIVLTEKNSREIVESGARAVKRTRSGSVNNKRFGVGDSVEERFFVSSSSESFLVVFFER